MFFYQSGIVNPAEQRSDILRRCLFLRRAYLFAWGCVSWQGWPLGSLETDRRAVRSWAGWEWAGLVGREQQQVARPTIDSGKSQAHGLNHVLALWGLILLWRKKEPSDDEVEKEFASRTATQDLPSYLELEKWTCLNQLWEKCRHLRSRMSAFLERPPDSRWIFLLSWIF